MKYGEYRRLLEAEHAVTNLAIGVVKFRETYEYYLHSQKQRVGNPDRKNMLDMASRHEMVHVLQCITTSSALNTAEDRRFLLSQIIEYKVQGAKWEDLLPNARKEYSLIKERFESPKPTGIKESHGQMEISVQQIFEDMAISQTTLSMMVYPREQILDIFKNTPSDYRYGRCFGILMRMLGPAAAIKLSSTIYFICLNSEEPQKIFGQLVNTLYEYPYSFINSLGEGQALDFLSELLAIDWSKSILCRFSHGEKLSISPMWNLIGSQFATSGPIELVLRVAANPSSLLAQTNWSEGLDSDKIAAAVPPLSLWSDGVGILSKALPSDHLQVLLNAMAISGAIERLLDDSEPFVPCQVKCCPVRDSGLCHSHFPPPADSNWEDCSFHNLAQSLFDLQPDELTEFVETSWLNA